MLNPFVVLIPTMRMADLKLSLAGVLLSDVKPTDIVLVIQALPQFYKDYQIKQYLSAFDALGIKVTVKRFEKPIGIGPARAVAINIAQKLKNKEDKHDLALFLDDDVILEPNTLSQLFVSRYEVKEANWVAPTVLIPSNEQGLPYWSNRKVSYKFTSTRAKELAHEYPFVWQWNPISDKKIRRVWHNVAMTACLLFPVQEVSGSTIKGLEAWKGAGEDEFLTKSLGKGIIDLNASVFHFVGREQQREWVAERKHLT